MKHFFAHIQNNIFRGMLAMIPLALSTLAVFICYELIDHKIMAFLGQYWDVRHIPGFGILLLLLFLAAVGMVVSNVVGKQLMGIVSSISERIPVIGQIYSLSKQVSDALVRDGGKDIFTKAVLVNYPNPGQWSIAFLVGRVKDTQGGELLKVFIPMAHPAIGFVYLVKETQVTFPDWSVDEALKLVVSLGLIPPKVRRL